MQQEAQITLEDKIHRTMTWWRVPLMAVAFVGVLGFIHNMQAFYYGAAVAILGELIQMWATSHLHKDTKFTISGPYSHVRNPMYFGRFFVGLGIFIMTWNPALSPYLNAGVIVGFVVLYGIYGNLRVKREERRLQEIFAPHYQEYCSEIHRWFPRLKPYTKSESRRAKWSQVCANHEQIVALGIIVVLVGIYLRIDRFPQLYWHIFGK
ncbi:MAG: methyltransferase family protein [Armatimonadota bacterium]